MRLHPWNVTYGTKLGIRDCILIDKEEPMTATTGDDDDDDDEFSGEVMLTIRVFVFW